MQSGEWIGAAAVFHPDDLETLKRAVIEAARNRVDADAYFAFLFGEGVNRENVAGADPTFLLARLYQLLALVGRTVYHDHEVYGSVYEGPDVAYVVNRYWISVAGTEPVSVVGAVMAERTPEGWRLRLDAGDFAVFLSLVML